MHPDVRTRIARAAVGLVLRDLVGMVNFAMVDAAGMDVEGFTEVHSAHRRAFEMPARCALAPWRIPFHLPVFAGWGFSPDCEIARVAFSRDGIDPAFAIAAPGAGQAAIIGNR